FIHASPPSGTPNSLIPASAGSLKGGVVVGARVLVRLFHRRGKRYLRTRQHGQFPRPLFVAPKDTLMICLPGLSLRVAGVLPTKASSTLTSAPVGVETSAMIASASAAVRPGAAGATDGSPAGVAGAALADSLDSFGSSALLAVCTLMPAGISLRSFSPTEMGRPVTPWSATTIARKLLLSP